MRQSTAMTRLAMTVFPPGRRSGAGYIARWTDPVSGRRRQKTLGIRRKRDAYDAAARLADQIESGMDVDGLSWEQFCDRYERQALVGKNRSDGTIENWRTVKHFVADHCPLASVRYATNAWIDRVQDALAEHKHESAQNTIASYLVRLRAALRWAANKRYIDHVPWFDIDRIAKPRSRAVTPAEFEAMLEAARIARPKDAVIWRRLMKGQYYTGLRISELLALSWDTGAAVRVVQDARHPLIDIGKQKNGKRQIIPITPEAWDVMCDSPVRSGPVFGVRMTVKRAGKVISNIGKKAGIVTNQETGKTATSHDLRRAFFDWSRERFGKHLAELMLRHADSATTDTYYNTTEAEQAADLLWMADQEK